MCLPIWQPCGTTQCKCKLWTYWPCTLSQAPRGHLVCEFAWPVGGGDGGGGVHLHVRSLQLLLSQHLLLEKVGLDAWHTQQSVTRMQSGLHKHAWEVMAIPLCGGGRGHMQEGEGVNRESSRDRSCIMVVSAPSATL